MTDAQGGEAAAVDTNAQAAVEAAVSSQEGASERDWEADARDMGWVPEAEWKGDKKPAKFLSAEEFVERGETMIPILNKRLKEKDAEFAERLAKIEKVNAKTVEKLQAAHVKELAELRAAKTVAVKAGNVEEVDRLDEQIENLKANDPADEAKEDPRKVQEAWIANNDWWEQDEELTAYAIGMSQNILAKNPKISMADNLKQTDAKLREKFPEKFGLKKSGANGHAPVDAGGDFPGTSRTDPLSKLPNEARAQAKSDMAKFPDMYPTAEAWIKVYQS